MRTTTLMVLGMVALMPNALAYDEDEAPRVRLEQASKADVVAVWHTPSTVMPGQQWQGFIRFLPPHGVENAHYQICRVGYSCFAPPAPAQRINETTWSFDTKDYLPPGGRPIDWQAGWRVGTQFILSERLANGTLVQYKFPAGDTGDPLVSAAALEDHYFAFDMPAPSQGAPSPAVAASIIAVALVALRRRS